MLMPLKTLSLIAILTTLFSTPTWASGEILAKEHGCASCHGEAGISKSPDIPNLAGQMLKYLRKQVENFTLDKSNSYQNEKVSERYHPVMREIARTISKSDMFKILSFYAQQDCDVTPTQIYYYMIEEAERCEICHGGLRSNPFKDSPNLAGQKKAYMMKQVDYFLKSQINPYDKNPRYHRLSELMFEGESREDIEKAVDYYASMGCSPK